MRTFTARCSSVGPWCRDGQGEARPEDGTEAGKTSSDNPSSSSLPTTLSAGPPASAPEWRRTSLSQCLSLSVSVSRWPLALCSLARAAAVGPLRLVSRSRLRLVLPLRALLVLPRPSLGPAQCPSCPRPSPGALVRYWWRIRSCRVHKSCSKHANHANKPVWPHILCPPASPCPSSVRVHALRTLSACPTRPQCVVCSALPAPCAAQLTARCNVSPETCIRVVSSPTFPY